MAGPSRSTLVVRLLLACAFAIMPLVGLVSWISTYDRNKCVRLIGKTEAEVRTILGTTDLIKLESQDDSRIELGGYQPKWTRHDLSPIYMYIDSDFRNLAQAAFIGFKNGVVVDVTYAGT